MPELTAATQSALRAFVAVDASVRNPIDLVASATADQYERALRVVLDDPAVDAVLAMFVPPLVTEAADVAHAIARAAGTAGAKPVVACFLGRAGVPDALRGSGNARTVPSFAFPEAAAHALARAADLADWRRRPTGTLPAFHDVDEAAARRLVSDQLRARAPDADGVWLDATTSATLLGCFGIPTLTPLVVHSADDAATAATGLGYPVALKAGSPELVHKTDVGGVALRLPDAAAVRAAYAAMADRLGAEMGGGIVQRMAAPGVETIVGVTQDPSFGPLVLFGYGGVAAELLADRTLRLVPMTDVDAAEVVRSLRSSPLFFGYRGQPEVDVAALEHLLLRVATLADVVPEVSEMDLNPVIVSEHGAVAVDVKVRVQPAPAPLPADFRRLRV